MKPDFTSPQQHEQEAAVLNALAALDSAAAEDGENPGADPLNSATTRMPPESDTDEQAAPEITDDTDFSTWILEDYRAVKAEDLAKLPDDIPAATDAEIQEVWEAMFEVVDPELGVNVVDLGLVYGVEMDVARRATVNMTLTSPACPLTDVIEDQAFVAVCAEGHARALRINWVWMPPWGAHMITDDGREQLRALGFTL
ncbi:hypothetical protein LC603019_00052 [Lawsonella clevelandensis]|uniref:MIP18 family-like domain-containing protein n=2 Tax=Lawsonella clevelandensis TaxID=1528099 RepID=A0A5E3ZUQ7_9ACTN|nr:hypothetical protein LC603019_00052 [Lawsonella clevelandensis]